MAVLKAGRKTVVLILYYGVNGVAAVVVSNIKSATYTVLLPRVLRSIAATAAPTNTIGAASTKVVDNGKRKIIRSASKGHRKAMYSKGARREASA